MLPDATEPRPAPALRPRAGELGFTLIEVLISMILGLVLLGAITAALVSSTNFLGVSTNRFTTLSTLSTGITRMVSVLRPAVSVFYVSGKGQLGLVLTPPGTGAAPITYDCYTTPGTCVETVASGRITTFATGVPASDTTVFTLYCRSATGNPIALTNGQSLSAAGCANTVTPDYVAIQLIGSVPCGGQDRSAANCTNKTIEVDGGTSLPNPSP